jgi:hypothetical protein
VSGLQNDSHISSVDDDDNDDEDDDDHVEGM